MLQVRLLPLAHWYLDLCPGGAWHGRPLPLRLRLGGARRDLPAAGIFLCVLVACPAQPAMYFLPLCLRLASAQCDLPAAGLFLFVLAAHGTAGHFLFVFGSAKARPPPPPPLLCAPPPRGLLGGSESTRSCRGKELQGAVADKEPPARSYRRRRPRARSCRRRRCGGGRTRRRGRRRTSCRRKRARRLERLWPGTTMDNPSPASSSLAPPSSPPGPGIPPPPPGCRARAGRGQQNKGLLAFYFIHAHHLATATHAQEAMPVGPGCGTSASPGTHPSACLRSTSSPVFLSCTIRFPALRPSTTSLTRCSPMPVEAATPVQRQRC